MKLSFFTKFGALNSKPVFDAFKKGCQLNDYTVVENDMSADVAVIWSVLWNGRMSGNRAVWQKFQALGKNIIVLEVGGIKRGTTWKVGLNGINRKGIFVPQGNNGDRAKSLGLKLQPWEKNNGPILICGQHEKSEQWSGMDSMSNWIVSTIKEIRKYTNKQILVRPHPRFPFSIPAMDNVIKETPRKLQGTYDDFNYEPNRYSAVVNWNSNPACQAVIKGTPVFTGPDSLAYDVANKSFETITNPITPDRTQWLNDYAYTEYTLSELEQGMPLKYLTL